MLPRGLQTGTDAVIFGNSTSCCWFCAEERLKRNREGKARTGLNHDTAAKELEGTFTGKPMFRFPVTGGPYLVCRDHLEKFLNRMKELERNDTVS